MVVGVFAVLVLSIIWNLGEGIENSRLQMSYVPQIDQR